MLYYRTIGAIGVLSDTIDDVSGKGWAADERLDYKGMVYIYKGEEVFLEVSAHALSLTT